MSTWHNQEIFQLKFSACCDKRDHFLRLIWALMYSRAKSSEHSWLIVWCLFVFSLFVVVVVVDNCECNVTPLSSAWCYKAESRDRVIKSFEVYTFECQPLRENGGPHDIKEWTVTSVGIEPTTLGLDYYWLYWLSYKARREQVVSNYGGSSWQGRY